MLLLFKRVFLLQEIHSSSHNWIFDEKKTVNDKLPPTSDLAEFKFVWTEVKCSEESKQTCAMRSGKKPEWYFLVLIFPTNWRENTHNGWLTRWTRWV